MPAGAYCCIAEGLDRATTEQLERMNQEFTAAVKRAFRAGGESEIAATATYDLRRR
jgi:hypothetical protein